MTPRPWQTDCRAIVVPYLLSPAAIEEPGAISVVTGGGKSLELMLILRALEKHGRLPSDSVIATSRTQLVNDLLWYMWIGLDPIARNFDPADLRAMIHPEIRRAFRASKHVGRYDGKGKRRAHVTVTTYPSLEQCIAAGGCSFLSCDEMHRSAANTAVLSVPWRFGMTGTPYLTDDDRTISGFQRILYRYTAAMARADGVIVPIEIIDAREEDVAEGDGIDLERGLSAGIAMIRARGGPAVLGPTLVSVSSVADARYIAARLVEQGWRAVAVSGEDGVAARRDPIAAVAAGELDFVVTVKLWGEGIDCPPLRNLWLLADIERVDLVQMVGRVVRSLSVERWPRAIEMFGPKEVALVFDPCGVMRFNGLDAEDALGEAPPKERRKSVATVAREAIEIATSDRTPYAARVTALERWSLGLLRAVEGFPGLVRDPEAKAREGLGLGERACAASEKQWKELRQMAGLASWICGPVGARGEGAGARRERLKVGEAHREALKALIDGGSAPAGVVWDLCTALRLVGYHASALGQQVKAARSEGQRAMLRGRQHVRVPMDLALPSVGS